MDGTNNIILSEVTQISYVVTHMAFTKKTSLKFTTLENLDNNEDLKRDIHGSNLHGM